MSGSKWGDFLNEKTLTGGFNRLRNWREKGEIVVWVHTNTRIHKRAFHMIPYVGMKKEEEGGRERKAILFLAFVCHENVMDMLRNGKRHVPQHCPLCKFIDKLKTNGKITDGETVWDSSIGDRKRDRICTKADFVGDTEGGGDWRMTFKPSMQYIIAVVDHDSPKDGIRVAAEKFSLGEKIKAAVQKEIDRKGVELGDPDRNPYAFKWVFNPKARAKTDYYDAYPFEKAVMTDEIRELLMQPELNLNAWIAPGDTKKLREVMEAHITVEGVDFDELFNNVLPNEGTSESEEIEETGEAEPAVETKKPAEPAPKTKTRTVAAPPPEEPKPEPPKEPEPPAEPETKYMECPSCRGKGTKKDGSQCKLCEGSGKVEAPEDEEPEPAKAPEPPKEEPKPEPKPAPTKAPEKKTRTVAAPPPPPPEPEEKEEEVEVAECGRCHKDVPVSATACPFCGASFL